MAKNSRSDGDYCDENDMCSVNSFCEYTKATTRRKCAPKRKMGEKGNKGHKCITGFSDGKICKEPGTVPLNGKCAKVGDCVTGGWCDVSRVRSSLCKPVKIDQDKCSDFFECKSQYCTGKVCATKGRQPAGAHCKKGDCALDLFCSIPTVGRNKCVPKLMTGAKCNSKKPFQCRSGVCGNNNKCAGGRGSGRRRRRLLAFTNEKRNLMRKTAMRKTMTKLKQLQRLSVLVRAAHKIDRVFAEKQLMNTKMVATLITSVVSFMHAHTDKLEQTQYNRGLAALPNQCISEEKLGTSFAIAINVENPSLLEWAWNALKKAPVPALPLPEILAAIMPIIANNQISDPACLADMAIKSSTQQNAMKKTPPAVSAGNFGGAPLGTSHGSAGQ